MKKNIIILIFFITLVAHSVSALDTSHKSSFPGYFPEYKQLMMTPMLRKGASGDGWDGNDWQMLRSFEGFFDPTDIYNSHFLILNLKDYSKWKHHWDGWISHTVPAEPDFRYEHDTITYSLNANGYLKEMLRQKPFDSLNKRFIKSLYTYNTNGDIIDKMVLTKTSIDTVWKSDRKISCTYGADNKITLRMECLPDSTGNWEERRMSEYEYDSTGNLVTFNDCIYNFTEWIEYFRYGFVYDLNKNIIEWIMYLQGERSGKFNFDWDDSNNIVGWSDYNWDDSSNTWIGNSKVTAYINPTGDTSTAVLYTWDSVNNTWEPSDSSKGTGILDSSGNISESIGLNWNDNLKTWVNHNKTVYLYNSRGNPDRILGHLWDTTSNVWEFNNESYKVRYNYSISIKNKPVKFTHSPAIRIINKSTVKISLPYPPGKNDIMRVYDLRGRLIYSARPDLHKNNTVYNWNTSGANKVYLLSIKHNDKLLKQKIVLAR